MREVAGQLAQRFKQQDRSEPWRQRVDQLKARQEKLEKQLLADSGAYRKLQEKFDLGHFCDAIPPDVVLIDFIEYSPVDISLTPADDNLDSSTQLVAFVISHRSSAGDPSVKMLDLGSMKPVEDAIGTWRRAVQSNRSDRRSRQFNYQRMGEAGKRLRQLIWQPLESHLQGAKTIIVSPDGALGRFPMVALPGKDPGSYLVEEYPIALIPVPRLLPDMLQTSPEKMSRNQRGLLIGGIDYGTKRQISDGARKQVVGSERKQLNFPYLPATKSEIEMIARLMPGSTTLSGLGASEQAFFNRVADYNLLHIATHGFFRSPDPQISRALHRQIQLITNGFGDLQQQVVLQNPGYLSGLAFSNANDTENVVDGGNDGIAYSAEIAMLPLGHVNLVVLSACETSLGQASSGVGEGLIGVQRAFQVAGARTTVASYWKIDDQATSLLMSRFYRNLVNEDKAMNKLQALREAQLWMLNHPEELQKLMPAGSIVRGFDETSGNEVNRPKNAINDKTHPKFWAGFVLSGDWR